MTTISYTATTDDCYGTTQPGFDKTGATLYIGNTSASDYPAKAWIPFTVTVNNATQITSATLKMRAESNRTGSVIVIVGCEDADNPSVPANWGGLDGRTMTTAHTDHTPAAWTSGTEYTVDVTTAVQEVLDRVGWVSGQTLAILIIDNGSTANLVRGIASSEHATIAESILEIVYDEGSYLDYTLAGFNLTNPTYDELPELIYRQKDYVLSFEKKKYELFYKAKDYILNFKKRS